MPTCMDRVLSIPSTGVSTTDAAAISAAEHWSKKLGKGKTPLRPVQGIALQTISERKCMLGMIGVGAGKTGICLLAGTAAGAQRPLLLAPPALINQMRSDLEWWQEHFNFIPPLLISYGKLSVASGASILDDYEPDLIIADECHYLRKPNSSRTKRFMRYFIDHPTAGFIGVSGTVTGSSLLDYAHLLMLSLRENAPVPLSHYELINWASCIDPSGEATLDDWRSIWPLVEWHSSGFFKQPELMSNEKRRATVRAAYQARLVTTPGVVYTQQFSCDASLHLIAHSQITIPIEIAEGLKTLEQSWCRPDGEELSEASQKAAVAKNLSIGFYYRWLWPDGEVDYEWLEARSIWNKAVREQLTYRSRPGVDSPFLVQEWIETGGGSASLRSAWSGWSLVKHRPEPPKEAVWISDEIIDYAVNWLLSQTEPAILWYRSLAIQQALSARGVTVYGAGSSAPLGESCAASILAHGTGKNLQHYATALIIEIPSSGSLCEQLIGRLHRPGQSRDLVAFHFLDHTWPLSAAFKKAQQGARYIEDTTGVRQRLNAARLFNHEQKKREIK